MVNNHSLPIRFSVLLVFIKMSNHNELASQDFIIYEDLKSTPFSSYFCCDPKTINLRNLKDIAHSRQSLLACLLEWQCHQGIHFYVPHDLGYW